MSTSLSAEQRNKQRFDVNLKARCSFAGQNDREHQCRITNLSATGACVHFETATAVKAGMVLAVTIGIPKTIMNIPVAGEIMWAQQQHNDIKVGLKFTSPLSESMIQQLTKSS